MIDEELYQQAADELNSDNRRAHIWARACALASDDHDEARYLYTNLRVEELIAERESGGSNASSSNFELDQHDSTLALEPISTDEEELFSSTDTDFGKQEFIPESVSAPSGIDRSESPDDDFLQMLSDTDSNENDDAAVASRSAAFEQRMEEHFEQHTEHKAADQASESLDTSTDRFELESEHPADDKSLEDDFLDSYEEHQENIRASALEESAEEFISRLDLTDPELNTRPSSAHDEQQLDFDSTTELDLNPEEIASINDASRGTISPIHGGELADDEHPFDEYDLNQSDEKLDWHEETTRSTLPATHSGEHLDERTSMDARSLEDDRLAQELERQADQLPGQRNDVIEHPDSTADFHEVAYAEHDQTSEIYDTGSSIAHGESLPFNLPVDLTLGERGEEFAIYKRDAKAQAVSTGVSWSALFLTLPFLFYRHLFGTAILYTVLWVIALGGLLVTGLVWLDAGSAATTLTKASAIGFALLAVVGLLYIPFRYGNIWRGEKLERRGFELVAWVRASSPGKAVAKARRATALD